jgi:hypothetical protein
MARPKGTTKEVLMNRKLLAQLDIIKEKVSDDVVEAYETLASLMRDKASSSSVRKGSAEQIIGLHKSFCKEASGDVEDVEEVMEDGMASGGGMGKILSLKMVGGGND